MSQNPDEPRQSSSGEDKDFESGLDYGSFASDEPDYPEDHLDQGKTGAGEESPEAAEGSTPGDAPSDLPEHEPAPQDDAGSPDPVPAPSSAPVAGAPAPSDENPTTIVPKPESGDDGATRVLNDEAAAAAGSGPTATDAPGSSRPRPADGPAEESPEKPADATRPVERPQERPAPGTFTTQPADSARTSADEEPVSAAAAPPAYAPGDDSITRADIDEEVAKSKRGVSRFFTVLVAIFTPILLAVLTLRLIASPAFLWLTYNRPGFPSAENFDDGERLLYGSYGMDYLLNLADSRYLSQLAPGGEPLFTPAEVGHMTDVKLLMWYAMLLGLILLVLTLLFGLLLRAWRPGGLARGVFAGAWATLAVLVGVVVLAFVIGWNRFFEEFHIWMFERNPLLADPSPWAFPADTALIQLYPNEFWMDAGIWFGALLVLLSLIALLVTWPTKRRRARRAARLEEVHERRREKLIAELDSSAQ